MQYARPKNSGTQYTRPKQGGTQYAMRGGGCHPHKFTATYFDVDITDIILSENHINTLVICNLTYMLRFLSFAFKFNADIFQFINKGWNRNFKISSQLQ